MSYRIEQLEAGDYEEMLDFIELVFSRATGPHDFTELLPAFYRPDPHRMRCHWVIRHEGRIRSLVDVFPVEVHVGSRTLKGSTVGAVSTHPRYRGRGMMSELMSHAVEWMRAQGIQLSQLGGSRRRYAHFGYEVCGIGMEFQLNAASIGPDPADGPPVVLQEVDASDDELLDRLKGMHDRQPLHCTRARELFHAYGLNWRRRLFAIRAADGECAGYLIGSPNRDHVSEIVADRLAPESVRACVRHSPSGRTTVWVGIHRADLIRALGELCEHVTVHSAGNWLVLDWPSVTEAFLQLKADTLPLGEGAATVGIDTAGTLQLVLDQGRARCAATDEPAPLSVSPALAHRLLFGPLAPDHVAELPPAARQLRAWCPLPLGMSAQDGA